GRVCRSHVIERLYQAAAHEIAPEAVGEVAGEERVLGSGQPEGEQAPAVVRGIAYGAAQWMRVHDNLGVGGYLFSRRLEEYHPLLPEDAELVAILGSHAGKKGCHAVVIVLAPFLKGMMMAVGALHAHAQEDLCCRLGPVGGRVARSVKVGRPVGKRASL